MCQGEHRQDFINLVLTCSGGNGFNNHYDAPQEIRTDWTLEEFLGLRDKVFEERGRLNKQRRELEQGFFKRRWYRMEGDTSP